MFSGLRSRWMMPCECASSSAPQTCISIGTARSTGSGPSRAHRLVEVLALEVLHHDVERAVLELAVEEHLHGVRVGEVAHRARLAAEARDEVLAVRELRMEDLDRHHPVHRRLRAPCRRTHASGADLLLHEELPVQDGAADVRMKMQALAGGGKPAQASRGAHGGQQESSALERCAADERRASGGLASPPR
jgi:hypothetical protein